MPYRCVHCSATYADKSPELATGCTCGRKFFFYIKEEKLKEISSENDEPELSEKEKQQIEEDVREIAGLDEKPEVTVFLDFESVRIIKPGKYLLDITKLMDKDKPKIYHLEDGKYIVDLNVRRDKK